MLEPPMLPVECPTCARAFVSVPSLKKHLRLDHRPADGDALTVAAILAEPPVGDPPPLPAQGGPVARLVERFSTPWVLAVVAWLWALYGLSRLGFPIDELVLWSLGGFVVVSVLGLHVWSRSQLRTQQSLRKNDDRPF